MLMIGCFLVGVQGFEPRRCLSQSQVPYRLATPQYLVGIAGFEPTNDGVKVRCLTAWLYPNIGIRASS